MHTLNSQYDAHAVHQAIAITPCAAKPKKQIVPLRVLHIVASMNRGGIETMIVNLQRRLDRTKIQFDYLVTRKKNHHYAEEIANLGGVVHQAPLVEDVGFFKFKKFAAALLADHREYSIVHCHMNAWSGFFLPLAKRAGIPIRIAHSHNTATTPGLYGRLSYLCKLYAKHQIAKSATHYFACSKAAGDWLFGNGVSEGRLKILNNAIETTRFSYSPITASAKRAELGLTSDKLVVGHVGRLDLQKNHTFLIDLFHAFHRRQPNSVLLLVGDGALRTNLEQQVRTLGIADSVRFLGVRSDIPALLQVMDVFVFPSLFEGLGMVAIEAQASGLPCVVSSTVPGECDVTGNVRFLPLSSGPDAWAEELLKLQGVHRFTDALQKVASAGYDVRQTAKWLEEFYLRQYNGSSGR